MKKQCGEKIRKNQKRYYFWGDREDICSKILDIYIYTRIRKERNRSWILFENTSVWQMNRFPLGTQISPMKLGKTSQDIRMRLSFENELLLFGH